MPRASHTTRRQKTRHQHPDGQCLVIAEAALADGGGWLPVERASNHIPSSAPHQVKARMAAAVLGDPEPGPAEIT